MLGLMGCGAAEAAWALFVLLLSTLVCCQPTEVILDFVLFHTFSNFTASPLELPLDAAKVLAQGQELIPLTGTGMSKA